jgi:hypothetical protein
MKENARGIFNVDEKYSLTYCFFTEYNSHHYKPEYTYRERENNGALCKLKRM